jgi:hypothetical protein
MEHDHSPLAAYALGALDADEARAMDAHLTGCAECRGELDELAALEAALGGVPPEAFLDGPPEGGDLLLQRTLRRVRAERGRVQRPRRLLVAAGVAGLVAAALVGGTVLGRQTAPKAVQAAGGTPTATAAPTSPGGSSPGASLPPGTQTFTATDAGTGVAMAVALTPAAGWVRVHVKTEGIKAGLRCRLEVVDRKGGRLLAGSWLVSPLGEKTGTSLDGAALVAPADVASIDVVTFDGRRLVSVPTV